MIERQERELDPPTSTVPSWKVRAERLPQDWKVVRLGDVIDVQGGSQPPKEVFAYEPREGYVRLLQIRDFGDKPAPTYVPKDKVTKFCSKHDIFIARYGASLGRIVTGMEGAYNVALAKVIFDREAIFPKYLFYLLQTSYFQTPIHMISRSAQNGFNKGEIFPIEIPLAPYPQQKLIVAEIEKQFSRLDEAVANLKRVKANLRRYKAAVLKAAVEGKLTEEWRKAHPDVEPASELLKRILAERRAKWKGKGKHKEPAPPDTAGLPSLRAGWVWATVEQLAAPEPNSITDGPFGSNLKTEHYTESGPRVVRLQNIGDGVFLDERVHISRVHFERLAKHHVFPGDLVIAALGENPPRACVIPETLGLAMVKADCIRFKPNPSVDPKYLNFALNAEPTRVRTKAIVHGVGRPRLNLGEIKSIIVPVPPATEQWRIVEEVDKRLSIVQVADAAISTNFQRAERLRQAVLAMAFCGRLKNGATANADAGALFEEIPDEPA